MSHVLIEVAFIQENTFLKTHTLKYTYIFAHKL